MLENRNTFFKAELNTKKKSSVCTHGKARVQTNTVILTPVPIELIFTQTMNPEQLSSSSSGNTQLLPVIDFTIKVSALARDLDNTK